jgi:hypothetical protein
MGMPWEQHLAQMAEQAAPAVEQQVYQLATEQDVMDTVIAHLVREAVARVDLPAPPVGGDLLGGAIGMLGRALQTPLGGVAVESVETWLVNSPAAATVRDAALDGVKRYLDDNGARLLDVAVKAVAARLVAQG